MFSEEFKKAGAGLYVKMEAGDKEVGAFVGHPLEFMNSFKFKTEYPLGLASYPDDARPQFKVNFVSKVDGKFIARVFRGNKKTSAAIDAVTNKFGADYLYEIACNSTGKKFNGHAVNDFAVLPERPITEDEKKELAKVELIDLSLRTNEPDTSDE